jgi:glycopeptide antibiotics resistance protein
MTHRNHFLAARIAYVAIILLATLTDLQFSGDLAAAGERLARALTPSLGWRDAVDGLRNIALFAGLGVVWLTTSLTGRVGREILLATLTGLVLSATVEGLQLFSPVRTASLVDLSTNTFGALAGAVVTALLIAAVRGSRGERSYLGVPVFVLAGGYGLAVLCEALAPLFDSVPLAGVEGGPLTSLRAVLRSTAPLAFDPGRLFDVLLFAPAGFLAVMVLGERGRTARNAWPLVAGAGAVMMFAAEVAHGMIRLPIRWGMATLHAAALVLGAWAAHRWLAPLTRAMRGSSRARAALFGYAALLALWGWRPLMPQTDLRQILSQLTAYNLVPLKALAVRGDVFSAVHVAQQFVLYLPLGGVLAVWPLRLEGRWSHLWPALWLAAAIELGHIVIDGRFFDVTNALLACAGLAMGWVAVRRAGLRPYGAAWPPPR